MKRPLLVGSTVAIVVGIAVTFLLPLLAPIWRGFFWLVIPGVVVAVYLEDCGVVIEPLVPVVITNALVYALAGSLIGLVVGDIRRRRTTRDRQRRGLCIKCGYDLTGNVSGVCPECGTAL